jgi:RNA polymerase sigma-70 factor (ECF subfamily)
VDEASIVDRCRQGDALAWEAVFERHYPAVGRFVFQLSPDFAREDVEEICQEAFLAAIRNLHSFRGGCALQTWLFRIAVNKARDYRERRMAAKRGRGRSPVSLDAADPETGLTLDLPSPAAQPDAVAMRTEQMQLLRHGLDLLGAPCREVVELRYFGDLSYEELSRALRLNVKTVSSRLSKCLDRLERLVQDLETGTPRT